MKKIIIFTMSVLTFSMSGHLFAQKVSLEEAFNAGQNFYKHNAKSSNAEKSNVENVEIKNYSVMRTSAGEEAVYAINFSNGGFTLVSANKVAIPVIAYSDEGNFDLDNMAPATKMWISNYVTQIEELYAQKVMPSEKTLELWNQYSQGNLSRAKSVETKGVGPLLKTKWDQGKGYNYYCPPIPINYPGTGYEGSGKCVTGCVATAIAQVMKYHSYPEKGTGSGYYFRGEDFEVSYDTTYYWDIMPNVLTNSDYETDAMKAVATVMYHAGVATKMDWGPEGSGTQTSYAVIIKDKDDNVIDEPLKRNFGYRPGMESKNRTEKNSPVISTPEWNFLLMNELELNRPIIYSGRGPDFTGQYIGHAFVCDGYQTDGELSFFHFNWGWSGQNDAFYYIDILSVPNSYSNAMQFPVSQSAIIGLAPGGNRSTAKDYPFCKGELIVALPIDNGRFNNGSKPNYYHKNTNCQWLLTVENVSDTILAAFDSLKITFESFSTHEGGVLSIYEGLNDDAPLIGKYYGNKKPPKSIVTKSKSLYFTFITDDKDVDRGWEIKYDIVMKKDTADNPGGNPSGKGGNSGDTPLSIDNETLSNINVYPNPAFNTIKVSGLAVKNKVKIYDIYGKELFNETNFKTNEINISNLSAGIYFMKISNENETKTLKFIKK